MPIKQYIVSYRILSSENTWIFLQLCLCGIRNKTFHMGGINVSYGDDHAKYSANIRPNEDWWWTHSCLGWTAATSQVVNCNNP